MLQTWRMALHSRSDAHGSGRFTHSLSAHICAAGQSRSAVQSTQIPAVVAQTWPGHMVDPVQRVAAWQA